MTIEEYERQIREATDASIAALAKNNAAKASALSSGASAAMASRASELTGGTVKPETQALEEQKQNEAAVNDAVTQSIAPSSVQEAATSRDAFQERINADVAKKANEDLVKASETSVTNPEVKAVDNPDTQFMSEYNKAKEADYKLFSDYINEKYKEKQLEEDRMRQQEWADRWSTTATGATELASSIINMLSVGGLHASNQQYHSYSQDWMKKADENMREHRRRRDSMKDTIDRLRMQQQQLRNANRIEEMKYMRQLEKDRKEEARREREDQFAREKWEWTKNKDDRDFEYKKSNDERDYELKEKAQKASIAQGWARVNAAKKDDGTFGVTFGDGTEMGFKKSRDYFNTVESNLRYFGTSEDRDAVLSILRNSKLSDYDKIDQLVPYIDKYPEVQKALSRVATKTSTSTSDLTYTPTSDPWAQYLIP